MDDRNESSSGLLIGIIVGGVVLVLIILGGIGLAGWFFVRAVHDEVGAVEMHEVAAKAEVEREIEAARPLAPAAPVMAPKGGVAKEAERLLGVWEAIDPPTSAALEFKADGTVTLTKPLAIGGAAAAQRLTSRWELLENKGERAKVRLTSADKSLIVDHEIDFVGNNNFTVRGPFPPNDAWVLKGDAGKAKYERVKK